MGDICERIAIHCPYDGAADRLAAFVAERSDQGGARMVTSLPLRMFASRRPLVDRRAVAVLHPVKSSDGRHFTYLVTWSPLGSGPLPRFTGTLAVERAANEDAFELIVSGHYARPLNPLGSICDETLCRRIAHALARDLLRAIADRVENRWAHAEAARAGHCAIRHLAGEPDIREPATRTCV